MKIKKNKTNVTVKCTPLEFNTLRTLIGMVQDSYDGRTYKKEMKFCDSFDEADKAPVATFRGERKRK